MFPLSKGSQRTDEVLQVLHIDKVVHTPIVMLSHVPSLSESHNRGRPAVLFTVKGIEVPIMLLSQVTTIQRSQIAVEVSQVLSSGKVVHVPTVMQRQVRTTELCSNGR